MAQTTTTPAATPRITNLPPIGLGSTETAQINVVNLAANSSAGTAASCAGTMSFVNSAGATIGSATPFTLATGQLASARLPFGSSGAAASTRPVIRGVIQVTPSTATPRPPCSLEITFETYDTALGATHTVLTTSGGPGSDSGFRR